MDIDLIKNSLPGLTIIHSIFPQWLQNMYYLCHAKWQRYDNTRKSTHLVFFFFLSIIYFFWKMNFLGIYKWENPGWVFQNVVDAGRAWSVIKGILWAPDSFCHELAMGETESRIEAKFRDERCPPSTTVTSQQWRKKYRIEKCLQHLLQVLARAYLDSLLDLAWPAAQRCHVPPGAKCSHKVLV